MKKGSSDSIKILLIIIILIIVAFFAFKIGMTNRSAGQTGSVLSLLPASGTLVGQAPPNLHPCLNNGVPTIQVLSPNGGESYTAGQQITVKWNSCNIVGNIDEIDITTPNGWGGGTGATFVKQVPNTGAFTVTLPSAADLSTDNVPFGKNFKIQIIAPNGTGNVQDSSDNLFTINSPLLAGCPSYVGFSQTTGLPCWLQTNPVSYINPTGHIATLAGVLLSGAPSTISFNIKPKISSAIPSYTQSTPGRLSTTVAGLTANTTYQYQVCGTQGGQTFCANWVSFVAL